MNSASHWTGRRACALQRAFLMSNMDFAKHLSIGVRTVAGWHEKPDHVPQSKIQQILDAAYGEAKSPIKRRFAVLVGEAVETSDEGPDLAETERRLSVDEHMKTALGWLDTHAGWEPGASRHLVAQTSSELDVRALQDRNALRDRVDRHRLAEALARYYGTSDTNHRRYAARYDGRRTETSVLTSPDWVDVACPLDPARDRLTLASSVPAPDVSLDERTAARAARRLAETLSLDTRLVDMPLYRLLDFDIRDGHISGSVGMARFVQYALTMDLLEGELVDAIANGDSPRPGALPLRDRYLPDLAAVLDTSSRLCAGGPLALCAFARSAELSRREPDYVLLVQERSSHVLNATGRLSVIPKAFHQPMTDYRADAQIWATLRREMEEELFGRRDDVDSTLSDLRSADPMHPSRLSEAMRWLTEEPGRLRIECTGFGLNLISGNFEFAGLILVEDEEFWARYGGQIEANWESSTLRQYSSLDQEFLLELIDDAAWSNEGLFALLQGLRRLAEIDGPRVNLPTISWELV